MSQHPDVIVLGTGGVGSAALYHLASRGVRVLGLDQYPPAHDKGSSHGETRIIRKAYFEHPDYVPLLHRAYQLWDDLQLRSGRRDLFERTGLVQIGPEDGVVIDGVLTSAARHGLNVQKLSAAESRYRFPQYAVPEDCVAAYEADAGFLRVEECVKEHLRLAQQMGAELQTGVLVRDWHATADGVEVETSEGSFQAGALVITAGAWAPTLLASLGIPMKVLRKPLFWLQSSSSAHLQAAGCPCFFYELPEGQFYGFPELTTGCGVKMACHTGGEVVADPAAVDRQLKPHDLALIQSFAASCLPQVNGALVKESTCLYTMSPDEHFIVDHHPGHANVVFAAGLSGHGFKFASVLGEILADLALEQRTDLPAEFLSLSRFGVK
jgi:monomeric sarcosine oxidase